MATDAAHTHWWEIGEVVFGLPLVASVLLQLTVPLTSVRPIFTPLLGIVGIILCGSGIGFVVATRRELVKYRQPTDPGQPTHQMVTTGVFSVSRNPMYLGAVCFLFGIALVFKLAWLLILLAPTLVACHLVLIAPEERYLRAKFGETYEHYESSVYRWFGRKRRRVV